MTRRTDTRADGRGERRETRPAGRRSPVGTDGRLPGDPDTPPEGDGSAHDTTGRGRTSGTRREEGGGWPEPGEATRREPPSRRQTARAPARHTAPTDHAEVPSRRPRAGARGRAWGRGGPPLHTRGSEAQRRGGRGDP